MIAHSGAGESPRQEYKYNRYETDRRFSCKALFSVGEDWNMDELLPVVMELGEINLKCMALLDRANTEA